MDKAMTKLSVIFTLSIAAIIISGIVIAEKGKNEPVKLPPNAVKVSENVYSLGKAKDVDGRLVEGYAIIHRKNGEAKPPWAGGNKNGGTKCYGFLANGAKWKILEPWVVNPANTQGLDENFVFNNFAADIQKWEDAASVNILGSGSTTTATLVADTSSPDNLNEVYFGSVDSPGAIAVTIVWGVFSGPPSQRKLVEWDQVYDYVDFSWSSSGEVDKMDFESIATHELGHSVGLADLYDSACSEETMYGYASNGETKKRGLNAGDIAGINELY